MLVGRLEGGEARERRVEPRGRIERGQGRLQATAFAAPIVRVAPLAGYLRPSIAAPPPRAAPRSGLSRAAPMSAAAASLPMGVLAALLPLAAAGVVR